METFSPWLENQYSAGDYQAESQHIFTNLLHKPIDLFLSPLLAVTTIIRHLFAYVFAWVIKFTTDCAVTVPTASLLEELASSTDSLTPVQNESLDNSKLPADKLY